MVKYDCWEHDLFSSCMKEDRFGTVNELMRKTLQDANISIYKYRTGNARDLVKCFFKYMVSNFSSKNPIDALIIAAAETHVEFAKDIVDVFVDTYIGRISGNFSSTECNGSCLYAIAILCKQHGSPYKELFQEKLSSTFISVFKNSSENVRSTLYVLRRMWNHGNLTIFTDTKLQELDLKIKEIETSFSVSDSKNLCPNWHFVEICEEREKDQKLCNFLKTLGDFINDDFERKSVLIIVKHQSTAEKLTKLLNEDTMPVPGSNGEMYCINKTKPEHGISFKNVCVTHKSDAKDLFLLIEKFTLVVNYDYPSNTDTDIFDYIERIQNCKNVYTLFKPDDSQHANDLIKLLKEDNQIVPKKLEILHKKQSNQQILAAPKALETKDIDSLVDFIEGKPTGAIPKRKSKEKVPKGKKVKNKNNRKDEIIITPYKSEESSVCESQFKESKTVRIIDEAGVTPDISVNELCLENLCLEAKQDLLNISENLKSSSEDVCTSKNNSYEENSKSPDNASNLCTKMQKQKMELQIQLHQLEEKKTNINKTEDELVAKHSKEMAVVLNSKTDAENGMQTKCKKLNVINSEVIETDKKLNDLKKQIMNLEETKTSLVSQMKPIEKEIELDGKKIKKLEKKQNYLEGLCEANIEKIRKEKESVALERISVLKQIESTNVDIEKFQNPDLKEESETAMKTVKEPEYKPNEEMVDFLKTIIEQKEQALECPICFETAKIPIYMCSESHLICFTCKLKMKDCPVCRRKYPKELIRNRYAEEDAEKLSEFYLKMDKINNRP